jgi:hypothetical protein
MTAEKKTLGQAIDAIIEALSALDEKARPTAIAAACSHLDLVQSIVQPPPSAPKQTTLVATSPVAPAHPIDIRSLKDEKRPENAREMACLVAFYLQQFAPEAERKDVISVEDITKYFKQAHFPLPKQVKQLLIDARHSGYFDNAGRGVYRLNAVGYNLVAHTLPKNQTTRK